MQCKLGLMTDDSVHQTAAPWDSARPETTIITCVDGRWYQHFQEFAREFLQAGPRTDFFAVPGGIEPLTLADVDPQDFGFLQRRLAAVVGAHGTRRFVAIAHQDCAWYRARALGPTVDLRELQIRDLRTAAARLREMFDGVAVETYFARLAGTAPERVVFDRV